MKHINKLAVIGLFSLFCYSTLSMSQDVPPEIEIVKSLIIDPSKSFLPNVSSNFLQYYISDQQTRLFGNWSEAQKALLASGLSQAVETREIQAIEAMDLNLIRSVAFQLGSAFNVEEHFDHIGSGSGIWGGGVSGFQEWVFTIPYGAKSSEISSFLSGKLPPILIFDHNKVRTTGSGFSLKPLKPNCNFYLGVYSS